MRLIATVYRNPPESRAFPASPPGYTLAFRGGTAKVFDERTMLWVLGRADCTIVLEPGYLGNVRAWVDAMEQRVQPVQAKLMDPSGTIIGPAEYLQPGWQFPEITERFQLAAEREAAEPPVAAAVP